MNYKKDKFTSIINQLASEYRFYGPVRKKAQGRYSDTDIVIYELTDNFDNFDFTVKSDFSAKEIVTPLNQTLFHFQDGEMTEAAYDNRPVLVFLRSCDLHAYKRLDQIYLKNKFKDNYYLRLRELLNFALIGCSSEFDSCFCTTFGTNISDDYDLAINIDTHSYQLDVKNPKFMKLEEYKTTNFICDHVVENKNKVTLPKTVKLSEVINLDIWEEYNTRCIGCGSCNFVCPTCSCYSTQDITYDDNANKGERKRVAASCMTADFTNMAGGHSFRKTNGEKMRFKLMHKVNDFNRRFGYDMCVGCGRCDITCPELISFSAQVNKLSAAVGGRDE